MQSQIYCYTNNSGRKNFGIVIQRLDGGAMMLMDEFEPNDKTKIPARYCYISFEGTLTGGSSKREFLPANTKVQWRERGVAYVAQQARGEGWPVWIEEHRGRIESTYWAPKK